MLRQAVIPVANKIKVGIVGAAFNHGQPKVGVRDGPTIIRKTGFIERLRELGHEVTDTGDVHLGQELVSELGPAGEKNHNLVLHYNETLSKVVQEMHSEDKLTVLLGGDHSTAMGSIAGHCQGAKDKQVVVLWVDAHPDINTGRTSETGNMHGIVTSYLLRDLRYKVNRLPGNEWPKAWLDANHLVYIGLRSVGQMEKRLLQDLNILNFDMSSVDKLGLPEVLARCFDRLQLSDTKSLHLSYDIDSLDPMEAPSTGTPVRGGLSLREGLAIAEAVQATGRLRGLDLVEVNPTLGNHEEVDRTAEAAKTILIGAIAGERS